MRTTGRRVGSPAISETAQPGDGPVLLLDFDGTVCLGDGPVLAYAEAAFAELPPRGRQAADDQLRGFLDGDPQLRRRYADGYVLVQTLAASLPPALLQACYLSSRRRLADDGLGVYPAAGVVELLTELGADVTTVLLTNSPRIGVGQTLRRFGLETLLDQVIVAGGKPDRMGEHLDALLDGNDPSTLLSVGDHWLNDVRIPLQRGAIGGLITHDPGDDQPAHLRGTEFAALAGDIATWAADPTGFAAQHPLTGDPAAQPRPA